MLPLRWRPVITTGLLTAAALLVLACDAKPAATPVAPTAPTPVAAPTPAPEATPIPKAAPAPGAMSVVSSHFDLTAWGTEVESLFSYQGRLYFSVHNQGTFSIDENLNVNRVTTRDIEWGYIVWGGMVVWGSSSGEIYTFDGQSHTLRYTHPTVQHFGEFSPYDFEKRLYVGGLAHGAAYSADGITWTRDVALEALSAGGGFSFAQLGNNLYAMEAEDGGRIYRKASGGAWELFRDYERGGYPISRSLEGIGPSHEVARGRANFPLNRLTGEMVWGGSWNGMAYVWDGTKLLRVFEDYRPVMYGPAQMPAGVKPTAVEGALFIVIGRPSTGIGAGELWMWDGFQFYRILELPFKITAIELSRGRLWLGAGTSAFGQVSETTQDGVHRRYTANQGYILSLPLDVLNNKTLPPRVRRVWVDFPVTANTTYNSDDDGGLLIPGLGYRNITIWVEDTQDATLTLSVDIDGGGNWKTHTTTPLSAGVPQKINISNEAIIFLRLTVAQRAANGVLNARVILQ